ncbi:MAG: HigA family addiction module antitoxin [Burkholderiales bacterium]
MYDVTIPAEVFHAGEFLKEELEARGLTQAELAEIIGRPTQAVSEIVLGKRGVTPETAKGLAAAFGTSAEYWMNLETAYQLSKTTVQESAVKQRAKIYQRFPVKEIIKRAWVEHSENPVVLEQRFLEFFGIGSVDERPSFSFAGKKQNYVSDSMVQIAWVRRARQLAEVVQAKQYNKAGLKDLFLELNSRRQFVESIREIPALLAHYGIRLVIVKCIPGMKMTGACFWLDKTKPVIALTLTYDRVDNFWFTLFHELDHVKHEEGQNTPILDDLVPGKPDEEAPPIERRANENAEKNVIDTNELQGFIARVNPLFTSDQIKGFAKRIGVHPGIVVGQLQVRGLIHFSVHRPLLEKIREHIIGVALTDGFGRRLEL